MLEIYWDESGSHNSDHLVLGAYLAPAENWSQFSWEWKALLDAKNISYFRMKDFHNPRSKLFAHLKPTEKQKLMVDLIKTIRTHVRYGVVSTISVSDYNRLVPANVRGVWGAAYTVCIHQCLDLIRDWAIKLKDSEPVAFSFDSGHKNTLGAIQFLHWVKNHPLLKGKHLSIGAIVEDSDRQIPLQAADILAHESFKSKVWQSDYRNHLTGYFRSLARSPAPPEHSNIRNDEESIQEFIVLAKKYMATVGKKKPYGLPGQKKNRRSML